MRIVIQRVSKAKVTVEDKNIGEIRQGLLLLVGIEPADTEEDLLWARKKILNMRIFKDEQGKMNLSLKQIDGELLIISQFTLFASYKKGNRPSFIRSAKPEFAGKMYEKFVELCEEELGEEKVRQGIFGAYMQVELVNDGPVTIVVDTKNKE